MQFFLTIFMKIVMVHVELGMLFFLQFLVTFVKMLVKNIFFLQLRNGFIKNVAKNASVGIKLNSCHDNLPLTTLCVCHEGR